MDTGKFENDACEWENQVRDEYESWGLKDQTLAKSMCKRVLLNLCLC